MKEFEGIIKELDEKWRQAGMELAHVSKVSSTSRYKFGNLLHDIICFSYVFKREYLELVDCMLSQEMNIGSGIFARERDEREMRAVIAFKTMYFYIRAFQDAMYNILLELSGQASGNKGTMSNIVNSNGELKIKNPVARVINDSIPEYIEWFVVMKKQRDLVKTGINFAIIGPGHDPGISFVFHNSTENSLSVTCIPVKLYL